jgi:hypothetical protein
MSLPGGISDRKSFWGKWICLICFCFQKKIAHIIEIYTTMFTVSAHELNDFYIGIQLNNQASAQENKVRVNSDATLHISKILVDVGNLSHKG